MIPTMIQCIPQGPIAQWLEQSAHKTCAIVCISFLPDYKNQVVLRQKYLKRNLTWKGKPKGDNSMVVDSLVRFLCGNQDTRQLGRIWLRLDCLNPSRSGYSDDPPIVQNCGCTESASDVKVMRLVECLLCNSTR